MATFLSILMSLSILHCYYEIVVSQSFEVFLHRVDGFYIYCPDFVDNAPASCFPAETQSYLFDGVTDTDLNAGTAHNCDGNFYIYNLFDSAPSQIYRFSIPISPTEGPDTAPIMDNTAGISGVTSFEICCNRIIFSAGDEIFVQNLQDTSGNRITKRLYQAHTAITKIEVCCYNDNYNVFYSIDGDGVYALSMDGHKSTQIVVYDSSPNVEAFEVNCAIGHMAFGGGDTVYVWDYAGENPDNLPISLTTDVDAWETRTGETVNALSLASSSGAPNVLTAWVNGPGPGYALTFSTDSETSHLITGTLYNNAFDDVLLCLDDQDCSLGCPSGNPCPCDGSDNFQSCCAGLCVPRNDVGTEDYSCFCSNEETFSVDMCYASSPLSPVLTACPIDLIGAVKCQGGSRTSSSSIYAISAFSFTSICATDVRGKEQPLPPGTLPLMAHDMFSSAYLFKGPTNLNNFHGDRYGLYNVMTTNPDISSIPVIVQERSDAIIGEHITISANENDEVTIKVLVPRYCNTRQIRWRKNGNFLKKYNGKAATTFDSVKPSHEGIYEIYFQGRIKRNWRRIVRVIVRSDTCSGKCTENGGVCSYSNKYCICPPGRVGLLCENVCTKGNFGIRGNCNLNCQEVFGDECSDCQNILFCSEDPFGCQCYPGYEQPNCTPCRNGFFGINCKGECSCSSTEVCDPYDGTCA